jgi:TonB family protein
VACALGLLAGQSAESNFTPARFRDGNCPATPIVAVSGGEVFVELDVDAEGQVTRATPLRVTEPFTAYVLQALGDWHFFPAMDVVDAAAARAGKTTSRAAVPSSVLVAAVFRPPTLIGPTLGEVPKDIAPASDAVPVPIAAPMAAFPPTSMSSGTVMLEVHVSAAGMVSDVGVIESSPPFDEPAVAAVREWRFRPARVHGGLTDTFAYAIVAFRMPVGGPPPALLHRPLLKAD